MQNGAGGTVVQKATIAERCDFASCLGGPKAIRALPLVERLRIGEAIAKANGKENAAMKCKELADKETAAKTKRLRDEQGAKTELLQAERKQLQAELEPSNETKQAAREWLLNTLLAEHDAGTLRAAIEPFKNSHFLSDDEIDAAFREAFKLEIGLKNYGKAGLLLDWIRNTDAYSPTLYWCLQQINERADFAPLYFVALLMEAANLGALKVVLDRTRCTTDPEWRGNDRTHYTTYIAYGRESYGTIAEAALNEALEKMVDAVARIAVELDAEPKFKRLLELLRNAHMHFEQPVARPKGGEPEKKAPEKPPAQEYANELVRDHLDHLYSCSAKRDAKGNIMRDDDGMPYSEITGTSHGQAFS